jgi:hypothetical protein
MHAPSRSGDTAIGATDCSILQCRPTTTTTFTYSDGPVPLDVLILLDDSVQGTAAGPALTSGLAAIAQNLQDDLDDTRFVTDIHVAVVPANLAAMGATTRLWPDSQACPQPEGSYLGASLLCGHPSNFQGSLAEALTCAGNHLPSSGQPSQPLESLLALLSPGGLAETTGFRRPNAHLVLGIASATDDPDLGTDAKLATHANALLGLVPDPSAIDIAVVGPAEAQGLRSFLRKFEGSPYDDLAAPSWPSFSYLAWREHHSQVCLIGRIADPNDSGTTQPLCVVVERDQSLDGTVAERILPQCPATTADDALAAPCWRTMVDHLRCSTDLRMKVIRPGCRAPGTLEYRATCATEYLPVSSTDLGILPGACGTADDPTVLTVVGRQPALGATVKNGTIEEAFTVTTPSPWLVEVDVDQRSPLHTAGWVGPSTDVQFAPDERVPTRLHRVVRTWSNAPGHVELSAVAGYQTDDGCYHRFPSPLLSYDVTP